MWSSGASIHIDAAAVAPGGPEEVSNAVRAASGLAEQCRHLYGARRVLLQQRGFPGHAGAVHPLEGAAGVAAVRRAVARLLLGRQQAACVG